MKTYYIDTNVLLRYLLKDDKTLWQKVHQYFQLAKNHQLILVFIPEIAIEIEYVLRKKYKQSRHMIAKCLYVFAQSSYIKTVEKEVLLNSLELYVKTNIDLVDLYLFSLAKNNNAEVASFDEDFKKLSKYPH